MIIKCPQCGKERDTEGNPFRPFCCERCKLLDLGSWISGDYRIAETDQEKWTESPAGQPPAGKDFEC